MLPPKVGQSSFLKSGAQECAHSTLHNAKKGSRLPKGALTDPNSIYRKLYNRSMEFFLWVIDREPAPYIFKLHVQALSKNEMKTSTVKRSVQALIPPGGSAKKVTPAKVQVQFFSKKKQFKVFVEVHDAKQAHHFFAKTFFMKQLAILDDNFAEVFEREMRVYLVKTEEEFT